MRFEELDKNKQTLICKADSIGKMMQVNTDGYTPHSRQHLAMGLASIHIAQLLEVCTVLEEAYGKCNCQHISPQFILLNKDQDII